MYKKENLLSKIGIFILVHTRGQQNLGLRFYIRFIKCITPKSSVRSSFLNFFNEIIQNLFNFFFYQLLSNTADTTDN